MSETAKPKSKFKVGDRVAVYNDYKRTIGVVSSVEYDGTLRVVRVEYPSGEYYSAFPQQVRRLVKTPLARTWGNVYKSGVINAGYTSKEMAVRGAAPNVERAGVEFVEARRKK